MSDGDEWWDIVDAGGTPTGAVFRRGAPQWPAGGFHLIAAVCVQREDGTVLLTRRAAGKEFAFGWEFPGGSALAGESSRNAASRELREETGLDAEPSGLELIGRFTETSALLDFYVARAGPALEVTLQASEVMTAEWVAPEEVVRRLAAGAMAAPWAARLNCLWPSIRHALTRTP
ncbi:NUDIX hydrolase [Arthrobacter sp. Z1-15]